MVRTHARVYEWLGVFLHSCLDCDPRFLLAGLPLAFSFFFSNACCSAGSTLTKTEDGKPLGAKGKKFGFLIRFMQLTRFVERSFHVESEEERDEWVAAYEVVKKRLEEKNIARRLDSDATRKLARCKHSTRTHAQTNTHTLSFCFEMAPPSLRSLLSFFLVFLFVAATKSVSLQDFEILKVLGKGTFGKVMLGREKGTRELFAIKILKKDVILEKEEVGHTLTENTVLQSTDHPFLTSQFPAPRLLPCLPSCALAPRTLCVAKPVSPFVCLFGWLVGQWSRPPCAHMPGCCFCFSKPFAPLHCCVQLHRSVDAEHLLRSRGKGAFLIKLCTSNPDAAFNLGTRQCFCLSVCVQ